MKECHINHLLLDHCPLSQRTQSSSSKLIMTRTQSPLFRDLHLSSAACLTWPAGLLNWRLIAECCYTSGPELVRSFAFRAKESRAAEPFKGSLFCVIRIYKSKLKEMPTQPRQGNHFLFRIRLYGDFGVVCCRVDIGMKPLSPIIVFVQVEAICRKSIRRNTNKTRDRTSEIVQFPSTSGLFLSLLFSSF
jgi:hypothetical protein